MKNGRGLTGTVLYNSRCLVDRKAEGGPSPGNGNVAHCLVHQFRAVDIRFIEYGGGFGRIRERVVAQIGIGLVLGITGNCRGLVVGWEYDVALT